MPQKDHCQVFKSNRNNKLTEKIVSFIVIVFQFIEIHPLQTSYIKQVELFPQLSDKQLNY